jgi:hypothetical protein
LGRAGPLPRREQGPTGSGRSPTSCRQPRGAGSEKGGAPSISSVRNPSPHSTVVRADRTPIAAENVSRRPPISFWRGTTSAPATTIAGNLHGACNVSTRRDTPSPPRKRVAEGRVRAAAPPNAPHSRGSKPGWQRQEGQAPSLRGSCPSRQPTPEEVWGTFGARIKLIVPCGERPCGPFSPGPDAGGARAHGACSRPPPPRHGLRRKPFAAERRSARR